MLPLAITLPHGSTQTPNKGETSPESVHGFVHGHGAGWPLMTPSAATKDTVEASKEGLRDTALPRSMGDLTGSQTSSYSIEEDLQHFLGGLLAEGD